MMRKPSLCQIVKHDSPTNQFVIARNLQPKDLGAVIFGCTDYTFAECHTRQLFGLPRAHLSYVQNIKEGLPLFLFNYDDRRLHGIYEAASNGKLCTQSNAWCHQGKEKTGYPAQVAMRLKVRCFPLVESQFRNAILNNYHQRPGAPGKMRYFHFELDHAQTHALMNMFTPLLSPYNSSTPPIAAPVHEHVRQSTLPPVPAPQVEGNSGVKSEKAVKPYADVVQKEKHEEAGNVVGVNVKHATSNCKCSNGFNDIHCGDTPLEGKIYASPLNKDAKKQQLQSSRLDKNLTFEPEKLKMQSAQQHSSEFCANPTATSATDTYICKDPQYVKSIIPDGLSNLPERIDAEVDELTLGHSNPQVQSFRSCPKAKMMNTGCTPTNKLSPSSPAITQQFQKTESQLKRAVYGTRNNSNENGALEATDPAGHPQSHCADSMSIRPITISRSQACSRDENLLREGRRQKKAKLAIQRQSSGHDEIHKMHPNELLSPDYTSWYVKDRLVGKITCMVCGEEGHYTCDCPMKNRENKVVCTLCNKVGHCRLWCCRQHVSENRACRRCGEKGHYTNKDLSHCEEKYTNMYVRCSSCDESHPLGRCPMGKVTCFLCEGKDHVPAHCQLSPMLTVTQFYREGFRAILKQALTETSRRAVTPAKLSSELEPHDDSHERQFKRNDKIVHTGSSFIHCEQSDSGRKNASSGKANHAALMAKRIRKGSSVAYFNCHEEGDHANKCPKKKVPGQQEQPDVTCFRFRAKTCYKKKPAELGHCDVLCFLCREKGHYSFSCPMNKSSERVKLDDVTCINFDANRCDRKKRPPGELLCDITCYKCHDKGHYSYSCPTNKPPGQGHVEGHNTTSCPKKRQKKEQQK